MLSNNVVAKLDARASSMHLFLLRLNIFLPSLRLFVLLLLPLFSIVNIISPTVRTPPAAINHHGISQCCLISGDAVGVVVLVDRLFPFLVCLRFLFGVVFGVSAVVLVPIRVTVFITIHHSFRYLL